MYAKANKLNCRSVGTAKSCDTCRSCQNQEQHVVLMTRQRWQGKLILSLREAQSFPNFQFRDKVTVYLKMLYHFYYPMFNLIPSYPLLSISTYSYALICFQSKQQTTGSHDPGLMTWIIRRQRVQFTLTYKVQTPGDDTHTNTRTQPDCGAVARLIKFNEASDINTSCHLWKAQWTKRPLVRGRLV